VNKDQEVWDQFVDIAKTLSINITN
jgi:hypothetical protein